MSYQKDLWDNFPAILLTHSICIIWSILCWVLNKSSKYLRKFGLENIRNFVPSLWLLQYKIYLKNNTVFIYLQPEISSPTSMFACKVAKLQLYLSSTIDLHWLNNIHICVNPICLPNQTFILFPKHLLDILFYWYWTFFDNSIICTWTLHFLPVAGPQINSYVFM